MEWDVHVVDEDGRPVVGKKVTVLFTSAFRGWLEEYTDREGHASFDEDVNPGEANISVDDEMHGPYEIEDGAGFTIEI